VQKGGKLIMAISEAMIVRAILEYFQHRSEEFEKFLLDRYDIDDGIVSWREDKMNKRLLLTVSKYSQDGGKQSEDDYAISITRIGAAPRSK
jgi:hypothetical protein